MNIKNIPIEALIPYEKNTKKHDKTQINNVAESIRQYGFVQPLVIDKDNVVVIGHCRLLAAKQLGMEEVPCVCVDDLTEEQVRALRIVDNKSNESEWEIDFLSEELADLDLGDFDFDIDADIGTENNTEDEIINERERTFNSVNLLEYDENRTDGFFQMPIIKAVDYIPNDLIGFNYIKSIPEHEKTVHFFIDDYQFERIWNTPAKIIDRIIPFSAALTPDFSLYMDMPMAMKVWNVYRSRLIGQIMQDKGIIVIPTLSWAESGTYSFCFDGLEKGGTYAVSTVGVMRDKEAQKIWCHGMNEAIKRLEPKNIICYGSKIDYDFDKINVVHFDARRIGV